MKPVGVGLNLVLLKEMFDIRFFNIMIYSKNQFQFSTNCQNISCSILSKHGIKTNLALFLKVLMSWAIINAKRKKLAEDYSIFSSIFRTSVILSYL